MPNTPPPTNPLPGPVGAGGGKGKGGEAAEPSGPPPSHNNEAGFARRMEAYARWRAEDAEDLQASHAPAVLLYRCTAAIAATARRNGRGGWSCSCTCQITAIGRSLDI